MTAHRTGTQEEWEAERAELLTEEEAGAPCGRP